MDKTILKNFAVNSRNKLIEDTIYRLSLLGITEDEIQDPIEANGMQTFQIGGTNFSIYDDDINKRKEIIEDIESKGFNNFVEEVAYTWFNRIIAIRYMEVNNYLPTKTRVLSSETEGKIEPDILTDALDIDLDYTQEEKELIFKLKDENKLDELFRFLFIKQSNKLNEILPGLFKTTNDSLELLLNISFTSEEGVVRQLIDTIPEEDFTKQVEIIGWLYQYYISEKKNQVININKSNIKKEDIPAATQLFTTDWVVKYMVDNSLGRYWIERNPNSSLKKHLEYYLGEAQQDEETQRKLDEIRSENISVEELTFFDPCMGSGHILVYAFDVFFEIYKELGYLERDIPELILKNNIFGLDIDDRAYQLAYFAVLMKARKYDRKILQKGIVPNVYAIQESGNITDSIIEFIQKHDEKIVNDVIYLKEIFESGKEFGSLIQVKNIDFNNLRTSLSEIIDNSKSTLTDINITNIISNDLMALINQAELLSKKYSAVVTNPPYMNKFEKNLKDFAKKYYKDYSKDLFSMFIYRNFDFCKKYGYNSLMTPFVWMFIKNYDNLRKFIINNKSISSLIQLEYSAFSEATVPICTFVLSNFDKNYAGTYLKLSEFTGGMDVQKEKVLQIIKGDEILNDKNKFVITQSKIKKIPGHLIAYWVSDSFIKTFDKKNFIDSTNGQINYSQLKDLGVAKKGIVTGDNDKYLKMFWEVDFSKINNKWFLCAKGGNYKKYYGNIEMVINWSEEAKNFYKNNKSSSSMPEKYCFKEGITYTTISSKGTGFRLLPRNSLFSNGGPSIINLNENLLYCMGFLNSKVANYYLKVLNPTINILSYNLNSLPVLIDTKNKKTIEDITFKNIKIVEENWNSFETSYEFKKHPLINGEKLIKKSFEKWNKYTLNRFNELKQNENLLNKLFISMYGFEDLNYESSSDEITLQLSNYEIDIKSFISYAVGCMFGRYSLDKEGLQFAGGEFNINTYNKFIPDDDNIIPILDTVYFEDDIVGRFVEFVKVCFGEDYLEENLDFIANALAKNKKSSREKIRDYFLKNFFNDHKKTYKKRPIYWQFSSGKENGFNCLVYMHRYEPSLVARIRTDYLHKTQKAIEQAIANCENIIENSSSNTEITKATKDKAKLQKQLKETIEYDEALAHIANQIIEIDLDDGVKVNYAKFQNVEVAKDGKKSKTVNLLRKI